MRLLDGRMAQTINCFEIFRGNAPHLSLPRFCEEFGPYPWVRLVGLREILGTLHLKGDFPTLSALQSLVREELGAAIDGTKALGEELFPRGNWTSCNAAQLRAAMKGELLSIEKAILVARATELACQKAVLKYRAPDVDIYKHLSIQASNCVVTGLEEWAACQKWPRRFFPSELRCLDELERKLRPHPGDRRRSENAAPAREFGGFDKNYDLDRFILAVMDGQAITWKNAELLRVTLAHAFETELGVTVLSSRTGDVGLHTCNELEAPFIGLTLAELNAFRKDAMLNPLSA